MNEETTFQKAANERRGEIQQRMDEIEEEIDVQEAWDPSKFHTEREKELREEYDKLALEKKNMEKIANGGLP